MTKELKITDKKISWREAHKMIKDAGEIDYLLITNCTFYGIPDNEYFYESDEKTNKYRFCGVDIPENHRISNNTYIEDTTSNPITKGIEELKREAINLTHKMDCKCHSCILEAITRAHQAGVEEERKRIKEPLKVVLDFVERWNKQDKEVEVAEAAEELEAALQPKQDE